MTDFVVFCLNNSKNAFHRRRKSTAAGKQKYLINISIFLLIFASSFPQQINAFWLPPDYWVTVYRDGQIEPGRSQRDFIQFPPTNGAEYIGYWINSSQTHQEAYGHVTASRPRRQSPSEGNAPARFCGNFLDSQTGQNRFLCGGFRILSYKRNTRQPCPNPFTFAAASMADPFLAVEYLDTQIARIQLDGGEWVFGGAKISERKAFVFDPSRGGSRVEISFAENQRDYSSRVEILQRSAAFPAEDLLDDSSPPRYPQPLPPIPEQPPMTTTTMKTTTTEAEETTTMSTEPEEMLQVAETTTSSILPPETTPIPSAGIEDYNDEGLSGAGIEWGALFTGDGVEEVEQQQQKKKKRRESTISVRSHRRRRHHHFRHNHNKINRINSENVL